MNPRTLMAVYLFVTLLPLTLSWLSARPPRSFWDEIASGAGMLALAILLVEFVLSGRFKTVSGRVGMDTTMRVHQLLARSALVLALIHPFLYRAPFNTQFPWDTTRQLTLTPDISSLATGILAWVLLIGFVLLAIGRDNLPYKYETWRLMHGLGALLITWMAVHHTLNAGRYSQDPILAALWIVLFLIALLTLAHVYFLEPILRKYRPWKVQSIRPVGLKIWELTLEPNGHPGMTFEAGQFAWINIGNSPFSLNENPFSISTAPASGKCLQFVIKELGDFTGNLAKIPSGTTAYVDGPYGNLVLKGRTEPGIVFIAGGVGVAPLLGILRQLHHDKDKRPTILLYGNRVKEQIVYPQELETLASEHGTKVIKTLSEPPEGWAGHTGTIDRDLLNEICKVPEMKEWLFILCGPPAMMESVEDTLIEMGVPPSQFITERFKYD